MKPFSFTDQIFIGNKVTFLSLYFHVVHLSRARHERVQT